MLRPRSCEILNPRPSGDVKVDVQELSAVGEERQCHQGNSPIAASDEGADRHFPEVELEIQHAAGRVIDALALHRPQVDSVRLTSPSSRGTVSGSAVRDEGDFDRWFLRQRGGWPGRPSQCILRAVPRPAGDQIGRFRARTRGRGASGQ